MSAEALPYTLLIIFAEFTIGGLWVLWLADVRGAATPSFIKFGAALVFVTAALTFWIGAKVSVSAEVDGYPLDPSFMPPARIALALVFPLPRGLPWHLAQPPHRRPGPGGRINGHDIGTLVPCHAPPARAAAAGDDVFPPPGPGLPGPAHHPFLGPAPRGNRQLTGHTHSPQPLLLDACGRRARLPLRPLLHGIRFQRRPRYAVGHRTAIHRYGPGARRRGPGKGASIHYGGPHVMRPSREETIWPAH